MQAPPPAAPFDEQLAHYRREQTSRGCLILPPGQR